jgi:hypothetical protein
MDGGDDLVRVDAPEIDIRRAEIGVPELGAG